MVETWSRLESTSSETSLSSGSDGERERSEFDEGGGGVKWGLKEGSFEMKMSKPRTCDMLEHAERPCDCLSLRNLCFHPRHTSLSHTLMAFLFMSHGLSGVLFMRLYISLCLTPLHVFYLTTSFFIFISSFIFYSSTNLTWPTLQATKSSKNKKKI